MKNEANAVKVYILDKEYMVTCPDEEKEALAESAKHLNSKMKEIRNTGKIIGLDRIAVMAGLNLAHESIQSGATSSSTVSSTGARLLKLNTKIEKVLAEYRQTELN